MDIKDGIYLRLQPLQGRVEQTRYFSHSFVKNFENKKLIKTENEIVDFDVESETLLVDPGQARLHVSLKTVRKEGDVELRNLAFPELNESIRYIFYPNAEVIKAGDFPKTSVFYVPPISLPVHKVKVGDTWKLSRAWMSGKNSIPLKIDLVTVFKNVYPCGKNDGCADLEISGNISIVGAGDDLKFSSQLRGRVLFSLGKGTVVWSLIRSEENLSFDKKDIEILSCLNSRIISPEKKIWKIESADRCDPHVTDVVQVPGIQG